MTPARPPPEGDEVLPDGRRHVTRSRPLAPHRDLMRRLVHSLGDDQEAVCLAYVAAERDRAVERPRGAEAMTPSGYARALWWEGRLKGWLRS